MTSPQPATQPKKVCFLLQRRFAHIGTAIAYHMRTYPGIGDFSAYVSHRASVEFVSAQNDVRYAPILFNEEIFRSIRNEKIDRAYLDQIEKEYGIPNLWSYLYIDRVLMNGQLRREYPYNEPLLNYDEMLKALQVYAKTIIAFLEKEKPDAIIFSVVGFLAANLLYRIAQKRGIQTITIDLARIKNLISISEDYRTFSFADHTFDAIQKHAHISPRAAEAKAFLEEFRGKPAPYHRTVSPDYNNQASRKANIAFLRPKNFLHSVGWHFKEIVHALTPGRAYDYDEVRIWWLIWDKLKRKIRGLIGYNNLYSPVRDEDTFVFYPLHYEPEVTLLLYAPFYTDQINVIGAIARSLPINCKLYVKEHPAMVGYRTRAFYKAILKNPNVRLIAPTYPGAKLARQAKLIATISSTVAWEGILQQKPVITFGDVFYNKLSFVKRCRSYEDLPYLIKEQLERFSYNEEELVNFISALMENSVSADYVGLWMEFAPYEQLKADEGLKNFARFVAEKIVTRKK